MDTTMTTMTTMNWTQANALCELTYQTNLISIIDVEAHTLAIQRCNRLCNTTLLSCGCWTGGYRDINETSWNWIDDTALSTFGFHPNGDANDGDVRSPSSPWHTNTAITSDTKVNANNAYIAYVYIDNNWKWSSKPVTEQFHPLCSFMNINAVISTTSAIATESIYKIGNGLTLDNDIYIAFLIVILGLFCIIGTVICFKQQTSKQPKDVYKISQLQRPNMIALSEPRANMTEIMSVSHELSSNAPLSKEATIEVMSDINSVNIIMEDNDELVEIKQWLTDQVKLPQYYQQFIANGYERLEFIKDIQSKADLEAIGITKAGHKNRICAQIELLRGKHENRTRELTMIFSETKHDYLEEEEQALKRRKPKHKNHQLKSLSHFSRDLSSLHYEQWKLEAGRMRESLSVSSLAARGQNPDDHNVDITHISEQPKTYSGKKTAGGFMVEDMSSSEDSHNNKVMLITPMRGRTSQN